MQFSLFEWASRKPLENVDLTFEWLYYSQKISHLKIKMDQFHTNVNTSKIKVYTGTERRLSKMSKCQWYQTTATAAIFIIATWISVGMLHNVLAFFCLFPSLMWCRFGTYTRYATR